MGTQTQGTELERLSRMEQCVGTNCPGGCCPEVDWYCCPDATYCAATDADCPFLAKEKFYEMMAAGGKKCDTKCCFGGTECPAGCCPIDDAFCCDDPMYCAA